MRRVSSTTRIPSRACSGVRSGVAVTAGAQHGFSPAPLPPLSAAGTSVLAPPAAGRSSLQAASPATRDAAAAAAPLAALRRSGFAVAPPAAAALRTDGLCFESTMAGETRRKHSQNPMSGRCSFQGQEQARARTGNRLLLQYKPLLAHQFAHHDERPALRALRRAPFAAVRRAPPGPRRSSSSSRNNRRPCSAGCGCRRRRRGRLR